MKIFYIILAITLLEIIPMISATDVGSGVGMNLNIDINNLTIGPVPPFIWMCGGRVASDDNTENGNNGPDLSERKLN